MSTRIPVGDPPFIAVTPKFEPSPVPQFFAWAKPDGEIVKRDEPALPAPEPELMAFNMTMRDHFAAQALPSAIRYVMAMPETSEESVSATAAAMAYDMADAMMAARKGGKS